MNGSIARCLAYLIWEVNTLWCLLHTPERCLGLILERSDINLRKDVESVNVGSFELSQKKQNFFLGWISAISWNYNAK